MRLRPLFFLACVLSLALAACGSTTSSVSAPRRLADPRAAAAPLVNQFFTLLERRDTAGLDRFLSPAFQVVRADGSSSTKSAYLTNYPSVESFNITNLSATQSGSVIVASYLLTATGLVNGKPLTPGPSPRLSTFSWNGTRWQLAAHANFNPLTG